MSGTARVNDVGQMLHHRGVKSDGKHKAQTMRGDRKGKKKIYLRDINVMHHNASNRSPWSLELHNSNMSTRVSFLSKVKSELKSDNRGNENKLRRWLCVSVWSELFQLYQWLLMPLICQNLIQKVFSCANPFSVFLLQSTQIVPIIQLHSDPMLMRPFNSPSPRCEHISCRDAAFKLRPLSTVGRKHKLQHVHSFSFRHMFAQNVIKASVLTVANSTSVNIFKRRPFPPKCPSWMLN